MHYQGRQEYQPALFKNRPVVQLPPIDRRENRQNYRQNARQEVYQPPDKYEQMRNRSRNNAERLQQLREIKHYYTNLKLKRHEKLARIKSENPQGKRANNNDNNNGADQYNFEIYEIEKVRKNSENITKLNGVNKTNENINTEKEIEDLERELALLKNDIKNQEQSIVELDELQKKIQQNSKSPEKQSQEQQQQQQPKPDLKDMVFGQRVKGKDMNDYWNSNDIKTTFKVMQNPGGFSQVKIGDDYNFFKDKENSNYKDSKLGKNYYSPKNNKNIAQYGGNLDESIMVSQQYRRNNENTSYNQSQVSSSKKPHPNDQSYNIINHSNYNEQGERDKQQYMKQQQQQLYSQQLREQILQNNNSQTIKQNQQSFNIFQGYPQTNINQVNKNTSSFINSVLYNQEKEKQNQSRIPSHHESNQNNSNLKQLQNYNQQAQLQYQSGSDVNANGKKNIKTSQPPGGRSQLNLN